MTNYHLQISHSTPKVDPKIQKGVLDALSAHGIGRAQPLKIERNNPRIIACRGRDTSDNWWEAVDAASAHIHRTVTAPPDDLHYIRVISHTPVAEVRSALIADMAAKFSQGNAHSNTYIYGQGREEVGQHQVSGRIADLTQPLLLSKIVVGNTAANKARKALFGSGDVEVEDLLDHLGVPTSAEGSILLDSGHLHAITQLSMSVAGSVVGHSDGYVAAVNDTVYYRAEPGWDWVL